MENWFETGVGTLESSPKDERCFFEVPAAAALESLLFFGLGGAVGTGTALILDFPVRLFFTETKDTSFAASFFVFIDLEELISVGVYEESFWSHVYPAFILMFS